MAGLTPAANEATPPAQVRDFRSGPVARATAGDDLRDLEFACEVEGLLELLKDERPRPIGDGVVECEFDVLECASHS